MPKLAVMNSPDHSPAARTGPVTWAIDGPLALLLGCASALSWIALCVIFETREAWDSGAYFIVVLPLLWAAAAVAGFLRGARPWLWAAALVGGQALGLGITNGGFLTLGPLPLVAFAVFGGPCFLAAHWAARRARRR